MEPSIVKPKHLLPVALLAFSLALSACGVKVHSDSQGGSAGNQFPAPELNVAQAITLQDRDDYGYEASALYLTKELKQFNKVTMAFHQDNRGADVLEGNLVTDHVSDFRRLDNSVTLDNFTATDLQNASLSEPSAEYVVGDIWYLKKTSSDNEAEIIFEILHSGRGKFVTIRYKVISYRNL